VNNVKGSITKKRLIAAAVMVAVIIVPLLYSYFYLGAFWDPYSKLEKLPVAVVNSDKGTKMNGEERNFGNEMCDRLKEDGSLKFVFTDKEEAKSGTEGSEYYAMIEIPENFSENIASAGTSDKQMATMVYSPNEKRNYLASQILSRAVLEIEESTRAEVDKEIVQELSDNIKAVPDQMIQLQDGLGKLSSGSSDLLEGTGTLAEGTAAFKDKFAEYKNGITDLKDGSALLFNGANALDSGLKELQTGAGQLVTETKNLGQLTSGAKALADGTKTLDSGLKDYTAGVDSLIASVNSTSDFLKQYVTDVNPQIMKDPIFAAFIVKMSDPANAQSIQTLKDSGTKLTNASEQLEQGAAELSEGSAGLPKLSNALNSLSSGIDKAKDGSEELEAGADNLNSGIGKVNDATVLLSDAVDEIATGAAALNNGSEELKEGIESAKEGVDTAITDTNSQLTSLEGLPEFAKAPVTIEQRNITSIPNYGTAFAPYFLSLSLWVGALILFVGVYLDTEGKFKILSRNSEHMIARSFIFLLIGFAQAIALAFIIQHGLGLKVDNVLLYYASCCLVSMVFISIVQFLMVHLKDLGKLLSIVLLILQLTSCGGTFPMETVPGLFNILYPFMPMTYSVALFKQSITKPDQSEVVFNVGILSAILIAFMTLTILISLLKRKRSDKKELQLAA
jgi:putative membrane protein